MEACDGRATGADWRALEKVKEESEGVDVANFTEQCAREGEAASGTGSFHVWRQNLEDFPFKCQLVLLSS